MQKWMVGSAAKDFVTSEGSKLQEYFVYFKISICTIGAKDPAQAGKTVQKCAKIKRERGDTRPAHSPVWPILGVLSYIDGSGGQNLAALCTAAGENLAAVSGSHSLAEAMNLGAMTLGGLVGTLHIFTPPVNTS